MFKSTLNNKSKKGKRLLYYLGSTFNFDQNSNQYAYKILKLVKLCAENDYTLVLDNLDYIYGSLYDFFNQRFAISHGRKYCNISFEDFKESVSVDPDFNCIIFKKKDELRLSRDEIENKLPSPLMNRFEKHIFTVKEVQSEGKFGYIDICLYEIF